MKQSPSAQLGQIGEGFVSLFFNVIGWGPATIGGHDLGTDLFVQLRDEAMNDLGLVIGIQVKAGNSWFNSPATEGGIAGWWFKEPNHKHAEYWIGHQNPHILVMVNEDRSTTAWVNLSSETIKKTGKGIKVFVPDTQTLDRRFKSQWIDWAGRHRKNQWHEGSRWNFSVEQIPENDWARHALLTPRLVAPHPNKDTNAAFSWPEAVAVCVEGEPHRREQFSSQGTGILDPSQAAESDSHGWRLASAIYTWVTTGEATPFEALRALQMTDDLRAAASICESLALADNDRLSEALEILTSTEICETAAIEVEWLNVHKAVVLAELGRSAEALEHAQASALQLGALGSNVTVSAIMAAAVSVLFELSDPFAPPLETLLPAIDNTASWWRSQSTAVGLEAAVKEQFRNWTREKSATLGGGNTAHNKLFSSALIARLSGSHGRWRAAASLQAKVDLCIQARRPISAVDSLDLLRRAGDHDALSKAITRIKLYDDPRVLVELARTVEPQSMTKTSHRADLEVLRRVGSYLSTENATSWLNTLTPVLGNPSPLLVRYLPRYRVHSVLLAAIFGLLSHAEPRHIDQIVTFLVELPGDADQLLQEQISRHIDDLKPLLTSEQKALVLERASSLDADSWLKWPLLQLGSNSDRTNVPGLREALLQANMFALESVDLAALEPDEVEAYLVRCREVMSYMEDEVANRIHQGYGHDFPRVYALLALLRPQQTDWGYLIGFLANPVVTDSRKREACKALSAHRKQIEPQSQTLLAQSLEQLLQGERQRAAEPLLALWEEPGGAALEELFLELVDPATDLWDRTLTEMIDGNSTARCDAADFMGRHSGYGECGFKGAWCQVVVATLSVSCFMNTSRGVRYPSVWRGRSLSSSAIVVR